MRPVLLIFSGFLALLLFLAASPAIAAGDPEAGARAYRACAACHSLEPGRHMTGPSLARIWGRRAGSATGFTRYSPALRSADIVWDEQTLDAWLANPLKLVPGNRMTFTGIDDARARADLVAYLKLAMSEDGTAQTAQRGGMMGASEVPDLKRLAPDRQAVAIGYCGDTYRVTTAAGATVPFWEFTLRFKTDSSNNGPLKGHPVLLPSGMMGDRVFVIFADPAEISAFVDRGC